MNAFTQDPPLAMTATTASCLIRYVEVWTPAPDNPEQVVLESAHIINPESLSPISPSVKSFNDGEGAIGSAMRQRAPVIFQDMPCADLDRIRSETNVAISAVLAFPVYFEDKLINVIAFGLIEGHGAAEIWTRDDRDELSISGSFYRGLDSFEYISQHVKFPKGAGLPGVCWKQGIPKMVNDPSANSNFIRSFDRDPAKLMSVIGLPISRTYGYPASILLLMSSEANPLSNYSAIVKVEAEEPTEDVPLPAMEATAIECSSNGNESVSWQQAAIDGVSSCGRCSILTGDDIGDGYHAAIAVPFSKKGRTDRVMILAF